MDERRTRASEHAQTRELDVTAEWIRDEVNGMPELEQRPDAMVFAERCPTGLEERLRGDHQDFHDDPKL